MKERLKSKEMNYRGRLFGSGMFYKNALVIAVPIMLQQLIQSLVSLVDNFMVSGLGDVSMSGVNVAGQLLFVFMVFLNAICMTGGIFMTQFYGARNREGMGQAFRYKLIMGLAAFVPYYLVCMTFPRQVLSLMLVGNSQAGPILDEAVKYIRIMFFTGIPVTISISIASSLYVTIAATLTNTILNWLLIYGHLGFPKMGVEGAALATVIARALELTIFVVIYIRTKPEFAVKAADLLNINRIQFRETLVKGFLVLFCEMVWALSETITTAVYNGRGGADVVSGMASGFAIANLFFVAFGGIYSATGVVIGKTLGAMAFGFGTTLIVPLVFGKLSRSAVAICRSMVILMAAFMPLWVYMNTQQAVARAGGDTAMGAYADSLLTLFVMIPMVILLGKYTMIGPVGMYGCVKLIDLIKVVIFHIWLKKERWLKNLTGMESTARS